jgi:hypothetical protein
MCSNQGSCWHMRIYCYWCVMVFRKVLKQFLKPPAGVQVMMRHRTSRQLDAAKAWNIENAYLACNPRTQAAATVTRTPLQRYIHKLIFSCVQQQDVKVDRLVRHLRRLPWGQCECEVLRCTCEVLLDHLPCCLCELDKFLSFPCIGGRRGAMSRVARRCPPSFRPCGGTKTQALMG